ncbi:response regulator [Paenibacillus sp. B2(2019)]|uniref:response regulator n=1 Tax=Paenibacillus sp. B2(2019) TaxID=2607754 RepID=UPI0011F32DFE|nr:response regulator [Paenibacillus sp. B2(2019)]KAA1187229.1 response regulator [Paenibacillus sp. B2(2019)]
MKVFEEGYAKKLTYLMLITIVIAFVLTGNIVLLQTNKIIKDEIESKLTLQSKALADQINAFFMQKGAMVRQMSTNQTMINYLKTVQSRNDALTSPYYGEVSSELDAIKAQDKTVEFVWVVSKRANFYIGSEGAKTRSDWNIQERPWFKDDLSSEEVIFTEPYIDYLTGKLVTSGVLEVVENEAVLGVIAVDILLDDIPGIMETYVMGHTGYPILLSRNGTIMYHPRPELIGKEKLSEQPGGVGSIGKKMIAGEKGLEIASVNGHKEYIGYAPISYSGWSVATVLLTSEALEQLKYAKRLSLIINVISICILVSMLYFLLNYMLRGQRRIQAELVQAKEEAEEANKAKTHFLARMSHEIRTPMNGIIGLSELMQKTKMTVKQQDYQGKILTSSHVLLRLINELLDFSKIEAGKLDIEKVAFHPEEIVRRLSDMLGIYLGTKQLEIIIETESEIPMELIGDPHRLEQVLLNLCSNAIKFTERGFVSLSITVDYQLQHEIFLHFVVEDTGVGLTAEQMLTLFEPFTQADGSTSRRYGGTGLGLVISQNLIKMMGGRLDASSRLGKGSVFSCTLPFEISSNQRGNNLYLSQGYEDMPVLIVEDHERMRKNLANMVKSLDLSPTCLTGWQEAIHHLEQQAGEIAYSIIFLDMEAEDMYGVETLSRLAALVRGSHSITIAMTTEYGRDELAKIEEAVQPNAVLIKPINRIDLFRSLQAAFEQKKESYFVTNQLVHKDDFLIRGYKGKILLAEDHEINQQVAVELLQDHGFSATIARNGHEVLKNLDGTRWDLILMDVHMPEMDGYEATLLVRQDKRYKSLPIVAMTASVVKEEHNNCYRVGMNGVLTKPIDPKVLKDMLSEYVPLPYLDILKAMERLDGKIPIYHHMLKTFAWEYVSFVDRLQETIRTGDYSTAKRMIHTLSGVAGNLSAERLFIVSKQFEEKFNNSIDLKRYQECMKELRQQLNDVLALVHEIYD